MAEVLGHTYGCDGGKTPGGIGLQQQHQIGRKEFGERREDAVEKDGQRCGVAEDGEEPGEAGGVPEHRLQGADRGVVGGLQPLQLV